MRAVEQIAHHRRGVVPGRVGQQKEALSRRAELVQRLGQRLVALDVAGEIGADDGLDRSVAVGEVDALANVMPERGVVRLPRGIVVVEVVDQHRVEHRFGQRKQGVDPGVALAGEPRPLALVELADQHPIDVLEAVAGAPRKAVAVRLEDVAVLVIDHQTTHRQHRIVGEGPDLLRVTLGGHQLVEGGPHRQLLDPRLVVERQRVVHVEADHLDLVEPQVAVDVDPALRGNVQGARRRSHGFGGFEGTRDHLARGGHTLILSRLTPSARPVESTAT